MNVKAFAIAAVTVIALGLLPAAHADNKGCTNAALNGTFADRDTGLITGVGQFAGVNTETFDGNGNLTGFGMSSLNGVIVSGSFTGTYQVNPDCTGTYTINGDQPIHAFFMIADRGNELHIVITDPGTVINCFARRLFPVGNAIQ